ncbi:diguanylate cyclase [Nocardioides sp. T5]|uniref:sensor domain-containing diguanylate cyclase n=1 Tax=Nocardioides sp. T5 TaxID=3400182 RepID=UPI003A858F7D
MPLQSSAPAPPPALATMTSFEDASRLVLDHLQAHVPMGFWTVSRVIDGRQVYLDVTPDNAFGLDVGDGPAWADSLCHAMWVTGAPSVAPDITRVPAYSGNRAARALDVTSYVGIPVYNSDQTLFGTICGIDPEARPESFTEVTPLLELLGQLLSVVRNLDGRTVSLARRLEQTLLESETDPLTGLRNRRSWHRALSTEEARHHRLGDHASIVMIDLDGLKQVNDGQGHAAGDALLRRAAGVVRGSSRQTDVVARLGGDEFAVLCPQTTASQVAVYADRIRTELAAAGLSAGVGVATLDRTGTIAETEAAADAAMYVDKRRRRAC